MTISTISLSGPDYIISRRKSFLLASFLSVSVCPCFSEVEDSQWDLLSTSSAMTLVVSSFTENFRGWLLGRQQFSSFHTDSINAYNVKKKQQEMFSYFFPY
jgi:hypothetical protein